MIKVNATGTTEMNDGRVLGLNHVFNIAENTVETLLAAQCKVGCRPQLKKMTTVKSGDTIVCNVTLANGKVQYEIVDEKAARKAEVASHNAAIAAEIARSIGKVSEAELLALASQMIEE